MKDEQLFKLAHMPNNNWFNTSKRNLRLLKTVIKDMYVIEGLRGKDK